MSRATTLERSHLVITGVRAELVLEDGHITITKQTPTQAAPSTVTVGVDRVRGTSVNVPSRGGRGWIHVAVAGGSPAPPSELAAAGDPYTLPITSRAASSAKRFARLVDKHVAERGMPRDPRVAGRQYSSGVSLVDPPGADEHARSGRPSEAREVEAAPPDRTHDTTDGAPDDLDGTTDADRLVGQLRELAELHRSGALTDEEFERAKTRLLD